MCPVREDQRQRGRFACYRLPAIPVMVIIPLNFAGCTMCKHENRWKIDLKATFHLTISMRAQRTTGIIQRNNYHHGSCGPSLTGKISSVFLIITQGTHRNVKNHRVRSSLEPGFHYYTATATTTTQKQSDYKIEQSSFMLIALFSLEIGRCRGRNWLNGNQALWKVCCCSRLYWQNHRTEKRTELAQGHLNMDTIRQAYLCQKGQSFFRYLSIVVKLDTCLANQLLSVLAKSSDRKAYWIWLQMQAEYECHQSSIPFLIMEIFCQFVTWIIV